MQKNRSEVKIKLFGNLKTLVISALFVAISIVCGKYLAIPAGDFMRFSFENLPILLAGIAYGPIIGMLVGVAADLIGCLWVGYDINILITLGAAVIGLCGGLMFRVFKKASLLPRALISVIVTHTLGSVIVKSIAFSWSAVFKIYGTDIFSHSDWIAPFFSSFIVYVAWRTLNYLVVAALESVLIYILLKNKAVRKQLSIRI